MIEIREIQGRSALKRFVTFPERLYRNHPYYVPKLIQDELKTLSADSNPAFEYCQARYWMAYRDGEPVGRIAGIISQRYIETWGHKRVRFGWFDVVDDLEVARALLGAVEEWGRSMGAEAVHGPLGFSDMDREGMLVEGFDELDLMITNYNYPYYPAFLEQLGYAKDVDWLEILIKIPETFPENIDRISRVVLERSKLRLVVTRSRKDLLPHVEEIFALINETYKELYSVVALSPAQVKYYTKAFFGFLEHQLVKIIVDRDNHVAAFGVAMPSLSLALQKCRGRLFPFGFVRILRAMKTCDRLDLLLTAVRPDLQNKGINAVLINEMWQEASRRKMKYAETGPELETNEKVQSQWKHFDSRQHRRRRCFVKPL